MDTRIIVALDYGDAAAALKFVTQVSPQACKLKVGKELFTAEGPQFVEQLVRRGFDVFLDLKFHDIPTTVARACRAAAGLGVWMLNVHALGGAAMVAAAREALGTGADRPLLIAVTRAVPRAQTQRGALGRAPPNYSAVLRCSAALRSTAPRK